MQYPLKDQLRVAAWEEKMTPQGAYYVACAAIVATRSTRWSSGVPYDYWSIRWDGSHIGTSTIGIGSGFYNCMPNKVSHNWTPGVNKLAIGILPIDTDYQRDVEIVRSFLDFNHLVGVGESHVQNMVIEMVKSVVKVAELIQPIPYNGSSAIALGGNKQYQAYGFLKTDEQSKTALVPKEKYDESLWVTTMPKSYRLVHHSWELKWMEEHALEAALDNLPHMNDNTIAFLRDTCSLLWGLRKGKLDLPESFSELWLGYRYSYSTTKLDVEEIVKFFKRNGGDSLNSWSTARGVSSYNDTLCRATIRARNKVVDTIQLLIRELDRYGLVPNWYILWDSIPYSFIVDWFVPIGELLSVADTNERYFKKGWYEFSDITYSLSYRGIDQSGNNICDYYSRYVSRLPKSIQGLYWLDPGGTSSLSTVTKRGLDVYSLISKH